ncbi:transposable element Tcb2 transposase [Trichonephila clavipes]|nr:transposable element Tcb2 transposase [Trichonephila clavipes]
MTIVSVWRPRGERLNPAFVLQRHTAPTAGAIFQQDNALSHTTRVLQDCLRTVTTLLGLPDPQICLQSSIFGTASWASHEFERTRGKVTASMERNVSRHHTERLCINARSYRIAHSC